MCCLGRFAESTLGTCVHGEMTCCGRWTVVAKQGRGREAWKEPHCMQGEGAGSWAVWFAWERVGVAMHVRSANEQENALGCWQWSSHAGAGKKNTLGLAGLPIGPRLAPWLGPAKMVKMGLQKKKS